MAPSARRTPISGEQLGRVVRNLLDNGARHACTILAVRVQTQDGHVELQVDDDGPGSRWRTGSKSSSAHPR